MRIHFSKMHGLGNDFVVLDATRPPVAELFRRPDPRLLRHLADRRFGIGCDQVLLVEPASAAEVDFGYRIFNADGSEVGQCGNGVRCFARYVREHGLSDKSHLRVRTLSSTMELQLRDDGQVTVNMGVPRFEPRDIPLAVAARAPLYRAEADGGAVEFGAVSMGNPHAVLRVDDVERAAVDTLGPALQRLPLFPQSVNVGFLQIVDRRHARLRVYERGSGETLACGSGACAAMAVGVLWDALDHKVTMQLRGGTLSLEWAGEGHPLWMTGPAVTAFEGSFEWPN